MKEIWKFPFNVTDTVSISMPVGAKVIYVGEQGMTVCLWAEVDPGMPVKERRFCVRGTGHRFNGAEGQYLGSAILFEGALVWHVYEAI